MAPRLGVRPARENDFSNVGKVGRRTGVTLPQGRLDTYGMEEISGIFSSPRKPSPLKNSIMVMESVEEQGTGMTPRQALSARKSLPPRSASPRKSGISGTARRSKIMDVMNREMEADNDMNHETLESTAVSRLEDASPSMRSNRSAMTPLLNHIMSRPQTARADKHTPARSEQALEEDPAPSGTRSDLDRAELTGKRGTGIERTSVEIPETVAEQAYVLPAIDDEEIQAPIVQQEQDDEHDLEPLQPQYDDEDADETFQPQMRSKTRSREPTIANSRRKRRSDAIDHEVEVDAISSPAAKRARRISNEESHKSSKKQTGTIESAPETSKQTQAIGKSRGPLKNKDANLNISSRQEMELNDMVEKIKTRPGQKKSLYILRRETPSDEGVTHTRSGRVSVKPLAYWRNEKCVFGGSPGGASLQDGARFPLNSIKEIIRTDEIATKSSKAPKKGNKGKGKTKARSQSAEPQDSDADSDSNSDSDEDNEQTDPDTEPWETEIGTFRGRVQVWDTEQQAPIDQDQEVDIAYAPAAIETRDVKDATFKYAKLISASFLGSGIVELPPGGVKRPKNSRKMHMSFFVASGRVTVRIGPINGPESRFSIGKGGFWQVPRGNQYSMENERGKTAKIFFSQACETVSTYYED